MNFSDIGDLDFIYATRLAKAVGCRVEKAKKLMEDGVIPSKKDGERRFVTGYALKQWAMMGMDENESVNVKKKMARNGKTGKQRGAPITDTLKDVGLMA